MNTWQQAAEREQYNRAVIATAGLTKDHRGVGFVKPHELTAQQIDSTSFRQNNALIFLLVDISQQLRTVQYDLTQLKEQVTRLEKEKRPEIKLAPNEVDQLSAAFAKQAQIGSRLKGKGKTGEFRVWRS